MAIPDEVEELFHGFMDAAVNGAVTLLECTSKTILGLPVYVMAVTVEKDDMVEQYPVAILYADQSELMDSIIPPDGVDTFDKEKEEPHE